MSRFYQLVGVYAPFDPSHRFETSWVLPPIALFILRALISFYAFMTIFFSLGWEGTHGDGSAAGRSFSYFTDLCYWGLAFYFLIAAVHTFSYARNGSPPLNRWPRPLQALHSLFYSSLVTFPFLVTIVFWVVIYDGEWFDDKFGAWSNISKHAMNSVFAFLEILLTRTNTPPWLHLLALVIILALYLGLAYVTFAAQGFYVYDFLDDRPHGRGRVAAYAFGILAAVIIIFAVVWMLHWLRRQLTEVVLHMMGKFHAGRTTQQEDLEMSAAVK
ncbi:MAG: hypothetical protein M1825_002955 [Sarcosagium campestre]|nr:MAG: hypothetical protein M1825_002955 [Sarcosagium campestre]